MADEDLTELQIQQLLRDAEQRLQTNSKSKPTPTTDSLKNLQRHISTIASTQKIKSYINGVNHIPTVKKEHSASKNLKYSSNEIRKVVDPVELKKKTTDEKKATAGSDWFNLPRTVLTPELNRDLQLLRMRDVLDPKRHYKKDNMRNKVPEFSQVGTIIEGPTEYFSGRLSNKERKQTLAKEILENEKVTGRFKKKYAEIQASKTSGKKAHYKKLKSMRTKSGIFKR